jgi:ATP-dependent Clp protease protease subunit
MNSKSDKEILSIAKDFNTFSKDQGIPSTTLDAYTKHVNGMLMPTAMTPNIIEESTRNMIAMDVFSRLMMDRILFLGMGIDSTVANVLNAQMLFLESLDPKKDITIYMNSPGGSVYAGLGIYDTMQYVTPDISTCCTGMAASMGYVLACAGTKGKRVGLTHSRFMQHQPLGGAQGQASDITIVAEEINKLKKELYEIISKHTGQDYDTIWNDADRDHWMTAQEAKDYGVIDAVLKRK